MINIRKINQIIEKENINLFLTYKEEFRLIKKTIRKKTLKKIDFDINNTKDIFNCKGFIISIRNLHDYKLLKNNIDYLFSKIDDSIVIFLDYNPNKNICENEEYIINISNFFNYLKKEKVSYINKLKININLQYLYHSGYELSDLLNIYQIVKDLKNHISYISINNSSTLPYMETMEIASLEYGTIPLFDIKKIIKIIYTNFNNIYLKLDTFGDHCREISLLKSWNY